MADSGSLRSPSPHLLVIARDPAILCAVDGTAAEAAVGDGLSTMDYLEEGLTRAGSELPDLVLLEAGLLGSGVLGSGVLGSGVLGSAGAWFAQLRAAVGDAAIYVLVRPDELVLGNQCLAHGATGLVGLPVLAHVVASLARHAVARRPLSVPPKTLRAACDALDRLSALVEGIAQLTAADSRKEAGERLVELLHRQLGAERVLIYLPAGEGARQLVRVASLGEEEETPYLAEEMKIMTQASSLGLDVLRLATRQEGQGLVLLGQRPEEPSPEQITIDGAISAQAATVFELIGSRERTQRGGIKDPGSSAYNFAYFVDVAGREIGRAKRHGRAFSLLTLAVHGGGPASDVAAYTGEVVERVLGTVRATDVLARVDAEELFLLLPETGGIGAHVVRRRLIESLRGIGAAEQGTVGGIAIGSATYPHCGADLSHLLRIAKHRADAAQRSVVRRLRLDTLSIDEILDALLWDHADAGRATFLPESPQVVEVPAMDVLQLASAALQDARRAGNSRVLATHRAGFSVGAALRAAVARDALDVNLQTVDTAGWGAAGGGTSGSGPGSDLEAMTLVSNQGCYVLLGRVQRGYVRAVHSVDPALVDLVTARLGELPGAKVLP